MEHEVAVFEVEYLCDECSEPVRPRAVIGLVDGHEHLHVCPGGHEVTLKERYPHRRYWRIDG
jgi:hypothetical protein